MKNTNQLLSVASNATLTKEEELELLKQDWPLLARSTRAARVKRCADLGFKLRVIARVVGVNDKTIRQDLQIDGLPDAQKLQIDRGAAVAQFLQAKQIEDNRVTMVAPISETTTKGMPSTGLLVLLRDFVEQIPLDLRGWMIKETRNQLRLTSVPQPFAGLTPESVIAKTKPQPEPPKDYSYAVANFWSKWIADWTLALVPDPAFIDDMLEIMLQETCKLGLASSQHGIRSRYV
ncbi:MAG: hypothetical protein JWO13_2007 [Acidobacteriales bacterium]|nr:hypothetical protein [Terriglobales bacterium]